jgi:hypothetical protein
VSRSRWWIFRRRGKRGSSWRTRIRTPARVLCLFHKGLRFLWFNRSWPKLVLHRGDRNFINNFIM